jgi:hypothetical protein
MYRSPLANFIQKQASQRMMLDPIFEESSLIKGLT